jgi:hypothetical protein
MLLGHISAKKSLLNHGIPLSIIITAFQAGACFSSFLHREKQSGLLTSNITTLSTFIFLLPTAE